MSDIQFNITPMEVVDRAGWKTTKRSGAKIESKHCPVCNGGSGRDERTFYINASTGTNYSGAWKCLRDGCRASGNFWQLIEMAGMEPKEHTTMTIETPTQPRQAKPIKKNALLAAGEVVWYYTNDRSRRCSR